MKRFTSLLLIICSIALAPTAIEAQRLFGRGGSGAAVALSIAADFSYVSFSGFQLGTFPPSVSAGQQVANLTANRSDSATFGGTWAFQVIGGVTQNFGGAYALTTNPNHTGTITVADPTKFGTNYPDQETVKVIATDSAVSSPVLSVTVTIAPSGGGGNPNDTMTLSNVSGGTVTNWLWEFGHPFVCGEITQFPQVLSNGVALTTQANVLNRCPDGSVMYARLAVVVPSFPAAITFQNQTSGGTTALTSNQMLAAGFNFDANISINIGGSPVSASARTMLQAGNCTNVYPGQVAQTILCADDSTARIYDLGFDAVKPIRPRFYATFWPGSNKVSVRFVEDSTNADQLQDLKHNITWTLGQSAPATVYTRSNANLYAATSWSLGGNYSSFWIGGSQTQQINIDHNIVYLASTKFVPKYEPGIVVPESVQAANYGGWTGSAHDLGQIGEWRPGLEDTGGRPDIAPTTFWNTFYEYTGDWRAREAALGMANLAAAAWQFNYRETATGHFVDRAHAFAGQGLPITVYGRPTLDFTSINQCVVADCVHGFSSPSPASTGIIFNDGGGYTSHMPDPFFVPYLLTADPYYLEHGQMWATHNQLVYCAPDGDWWCRGFGLAGPGGDMTARGDAWSLRDSTNWAKISLDNTGMKSAMQSYVDDTIGTFEGRYNITGTTYQGSAAWNRGKNVVRTADGRRQHPMHFWYSFNNSTECGGTEGESPWMENYLVVILGRSIEMGFKAQALLNYVGPILVGSLTDPGVNHFAYGTAYRVATASGGGQFTTWAQVSANWGPSNWLSGPVLCNLPGTGAPGNTYTGSGGHYNDGYTAYTKAAVAYIGGLPGGPTAQQTYTNNLAASTPLFFDGTHDTSEQAAMMWDIIP